MEPIRLDNANNLSLVTHTECLTNYQCTLNDFFNDVELPNHIFQMTNGVYSPSFMGVDRKWKLQLCAQKQGASTGLFVMLYGDSIKSQDLLVEYSFSLFASQQEAPIVRRELKKKFTDGKGHGTFLITKKKLLTMKTELMLEGALLINCEINSCTLTEEKSNHHEMLAKLMNEKKNANMIIRAPNGEVFHVQQMFLRMYSDVLGRMIDNEHFMEGQSKVIKMDDPPKAIELLLKFIYSGQHPVFENVEVAYSVLDLAERYNVEQLKNLCFLYMEKSCEIDNAIDICITSYKYNCLELKNYTLHFIAQNWKLVGKTQSFVELPKSCYDFMKDLLIQMAN